MYEKENWLYRALHGRPIVFSRDINNKYYTLTYGKDVAKGIVAIVGHKMALGEVFHIVGNIPCKWNEILDVYVNVLSNRTGKKPDVYYTEKCTNLELVNAKYQVLYGRYYNRRFDNSKIASIVDTSKWIAPLDGLKHCLEVFLDNPQFLPINWRIEAYIDRAAGVVTPLKEIQTGSGKMSYLCYRYHMEKFYEAIQITRSRMVKNSSKIENEAKE